MNSSKKVWIVALALSVLPAQLWAQPPGGGGGGRMGGGQGRGGPGMGMERNSPKGKLDRAVMGMGRLDRDGKAPLSKVQAKKVIAVIAPWRSKPTMTDAQAGTIATRLTGVLTATQKTQLNNRPGGGPGGPGGGDGRGGGGRMGGGQGGPGGGPGMGGPPPGGRDGGGRMGGPGGGQMSAADMKKMQTAMASMRKFQTVYNPLYTGSYSQVKQLPSRMQEGFNRRHKRMQDVIAEIKKKAG